MLSTRGWDVVVTVVSVLVAVALALFFPPASAARMAVALGAIALFAIGYLLVGRAAIEPPRDPWRYPAMVAVATVAVGVGAGAAPFVAILQFLAYPVVWIVGDSRRRGLWGSAVIAVGLFAGVWIGYGPSIDSAVAGATTAVFSFALSAALGLWITRIAAWGDERARLLAELTAAQGEIEALSRERGASAERERLAREIHDTLAQTLAGLVIFAERAGRQSRSGQQDAADATIATVEQVAREALAEARALVVRTAAVPSEPAFGAAVERLVERFRAHDAQIVCTFDGADLMLDREAQVVLLRCLQEALANTAKHAGASRVDVRIASGADGGAELTVADDGSGFDPDASGAGFGLEGMRDRVALAGGDLDVSSAPGRGTTLRVRLPAAAAVRAAVPVREEGAG